MFDYLVNKYNKTPYLVPEDEREDGNLYVKYTDAPYLILPSSLDDFEALHKRKFWYNLRRSVRLYEAENAELNFKIVRQSEELSYFLDQVFYLFNERWRGEYTSAVWKKKEGFTAYKEAMINLASTGNAFLAVLYCQDKKLLSYGFCLEQDNTVFFYQHTTTMAPQYRNFSLGKVLIEKLLRYAVTEQYDKFDFMSGTSAYKYEWAKQEKAIYRLIGKNTYRNYFKFYVSRLRYFLQFNYYVRKFLKPILGYLDRKYGSR